MTNVPNVTGGKHSKTKDLRVSGCLTANQQQELPNSRFLVKDTSINWRIFMPAEHTEEKDPTRLSVAVNSHLG